MMASRGMGAVSPSKMPKGKKQSRRDDTDFEEYAKGGWIKSAIKHKGALREKLGVKEGETIPSKKLAKAAKESGTTGKQARLAEIMKRFKK